MSETTEFRPIRKGDKVGFYGNVLWCVDDRDEQYRKFSKSKDGPADMTYCCCKSCIEYGKMKILQRADETPTESKRLFRKGDVVRMPNGDDRRAIVFQDQMDGDPSIRYRLLGRVYRSETDYSWSKKAAGITLLTPDPDPTTDDTPTPAEQIMDDAVDEHGVLIDSNLAWVRESLTAEEWVGFCKGHALVLASLAVSKCVPKYMDEAAKFMHLMTEPKEQGDAK